MINIWMTKLTKKQVHIFTRENLLLVQGNRCFKILVSFKFSKKYTFGYELNLQKVD